MHGGLLATLAVHAPGVIAWQAIGCHPGVTVQLDTPSVAAVSASQPLQLHGCVVRANGSVVLLPGGVQACGAELITADAVMTMVACAL